MLIHNADITGSLLVNGTRFNTGSFSGSFTGIVAGTTATASYVEYNSVANKPALVSSSAQITYSGLTGIPSGIVSGSAQVAGFGIFATTGSNQFNGSQVITGSLTVTGQVVAQTLNVQQVTSSIVFSSGSNIFGNSVSNTQQFTGSVGVTGSLAVAGAGTFSSSITADSLIISNNDARIRNNDATGRIILGNSSTNTFAIFYGTSHPTNANQTVFANGGVTTCTFSSIGAATFNSTVTATGGYFYGQTVNSFVRLDNSIGSQIGYLNYADITFDSDGHRFYTGTGTSGSRTQKLFIASSGAAAFSSSVTMGGDVGIGITTPFSRLHVRNSDVNEGTIAMGHLQFPGLIYSSAASGEFRIDNRASFSGYITFYPNGQATTLGSEAMRINTSGNVLIGTTSSPTLSTPHGGKLLMLPNAVIVSGIIAFGSPYSQNIQIDIVYGNWGSNSVIGLVDMIITLREYAHTSGTAFGKIFATNSAQGSTFTSFNTTDVTASQCSITATSGGSYTLRITIDPSNVTDRGSFYLVIPSGGGTGSEVSSITVSYV